MGKGERNKSRRGAASKSRTTSKKRAKPGKRSTKSSNARGAAAKPRRAVRRAWKLAVNGLEHALVVSGRAELADAITTAKTGNAKDARGAFLKAVHAAAPIAFDAAGTNGNSEFDVICPDHPPSKRRIDGPLSFNAAFNVARQHNNSSPGHHAHPVEIG